MANRTFIFSEIAADSKFNFTSFTNFSPTQTIGGYSAVCVLAEIAIVLGGDVGGDHLALCRGLNMSHERTS
jgi:hypothetical protein